MAAGIETIQQFAHPSRAGTVFRLNGLPCRFAVLIHPWCDGKHWIQARAARHEHTGADEAALVERTQRVQVAVEGLVLRIPFYVECHTALYVVDLVSVDEILDQAGVSLSPLHLPGLTTIEELLGVLLSSHEQVALNASLDPASGPEDAGEFLRHVRLIAARRSDLAHRDTERPESALEFP